MSANEYYRVFTDLSLYDPKVAANLVDMFRHFRSVKARMRKKRMGTRGEMIKEKGKHLKDLVRPRILREAVVVLALLAED
ncbi:hypothetical protein ACFX16_013559 [Malus domestica]